MSGEKQIKKHEETTHSQVEARDREKTTTEFDHPKQMPCALICDFRRPRPRRQRHVRPLGDLLRRAWLSGKGPGHGAIV